MADRWSKLAITAQVDGALDFSKRNGDQRLLERLVMEELEDRMYSKLCGLVHDWHRSGAWGGGEFDFHFNKVRKLYADIGRKTVSWIDDWDKIAGSSLTELWRRFQEQLKNPKERARLKNLQSWLDEKVTSDNQSATAVSELMTRLKDRAIKKKGTPRGRQLQSRT